MRPLLLLLALMHWDNAAVRRTHLALLVLAAALAQPASAAQDQVVNLYSARHYDTDEALYTNFTKATGIEINRIEAGDDALLERIRNEGANSPADVLLIVDAARLARAEQLGLFAPVALEAARAAHPSRVPRPGRHVVRVLQSSACDRLRQGGGEGART